MYDGSRAGLGVRKQMNAVGKLHPYDLALLLDGDDG